MTKHIHELRSYIGELLGPQPLHEIVITQYEDNSINYQIEGMKGHVTPQQALRMLQAVANIVVQKETPSE
jgi:hypothetical protein